MAAITGKDGVVTIAGGAVNGKLIDWTLEDTGKNVETTGAGDSYVERIALQKDWKLTATYRALNQATWDLLAGSVNTAVAFALKRLSSDTNAYAAGTGLMTSHSLKGPYDNSIDFTITIECNGTGLTYDTTPAT